jgi:hypothetical protein
MEPLGNVVEMRSRRIVMSSSVEMNISTDAGSCSADAIMHSEAWAQLRPIGNHHISRPQRIPEFADKLKPRP